MGSPFKIKRADGRSNAQVVLDLFRDKQPGTVFTFEEIAAELSNATNFTYTTKHVRQVCASIYSRLLKEQARALHNVRNVGYRLAPAVQHMQLAADRKNKADRQLERGLQTLQHVRWDEMDANQRLAHQGQLLVVGALYGNMRAMEIRQDRIEAALLRLKKPAEDSSGDVSID
jgi:homogentisate 1,2-dioxygenase